MRKLTGVMAFALAASVLSLAIVGASSAAEETTLTFVYVPLNETGIDVNGDHGLTPGDGWVSRAALKKAGETVGKVAQSCQYVSVRGDGMGGVLQCVTTATLADGQIAAQNRFVLIEGETTGAVAAITGGTGAYASVRGYVVSEAIEGSMNARLTFHLLP